MTPNKLYRVEVLPGGRPLARYEAGGGTFSTFLEAERRYNRVAASGANVALYTADVEWKEIKRSTQQVEGQEKLF